MIFGADDLEWSGNLSSRLLRLGWLFFVLITVSSYTANLAAFITVATTTAAAAAILPALAVTATVVSVGSQENAA